LTFIIIECILLNNHNKGNEMIKYFKKHNMISDKWVYCKWTEAGVFSSWKGFHKNNGGYDTSLGRFEQTESWIEISKEEFILAKMS
jgi:hypothetical protein